MSLVLGVSNVSESKPQYFQRVILPCNLVNLPLWELNIVGLTCDRSSFLDFCAVWPLLNLTMLFLGEARP